jgi:hypothetical protein
LWNGHAVGQVLYNHIILYLFYLLLYYFMIFYCIILVIVVLHCDLHHIYFMLNDGFYMHVRIWIYGRHNKMNECLYLIDHPQVYKSCYDYVNVILFFCSNCHCLSFMLVTFYSHACVQFIEYCLVLFKYGSCSCLFYLSGITDVHGNYYRKTE